MSQLLKSVVTRAAAAKAAPGVASSMFALGATRWAALGLRVAIVGVISAGATALDARDSSNVAPALPPSPPAMVAPAAPMAPAMPVARENTLDSAARTNEPPVLTKGVAERTTISATAPVARAERLSKDGRQGENKVIELIRRGQCMRTGLCRGPAGDSIR